MSASALTATVAGWPGAAGINDHTVEPRLTTGFCGLSAEALTSVKVKISDTYFLIALAKGDSDTARNLDLMQTRAWFDFPLLLNDDRIAKVVFQKSADGQAMLEKAFDAWK
jgi:hypothetical protein